LNEYSAGEINFAEFDVSVKGWINHVRFADSWGLRTYVLGKGLKYKRPEKGS
jgi:RNA-directed DNA polymerase